MSHCEDQPSAAESTWSRSESVARKIFQVMGGEKKTEKREFIDYLFKSIISVYIALNASCSSKITEKIEFKLISNVRRPDMSRRQIGIHLHMESGSGQ